MDEKSIQELRDCIDLIDEQIITLINKRMELSKSIGSLKKELDLSIIQDDRWGDVLKNIKHNCKKLNMDYSFIKDIYDIIHKESIKNQK